MHRTGRIVALAVAIGVLAAGGIADASTGKPAAHARLAAGWGPGKHPGTVRARPDGGVKNYSVVDTGPLAAPNRIQSSAVVVCPDGTAVLGGGVFIASESVAANVNSSNPSGPFAWAGDVNNASGADTTFDVYAICARPPKGYTIASSGTVDNPPGSQRSAVAVCAKGLKVLGGGGFASSVSTSVNMNSSFPEITTGPKRYEWRVDMNNASGSDQNFNALAICGKAGTRSRYGITSGSTVTNPAGSQTFASVDCPSGLVPLGGGVLSNSSSRAVNINTMYPNPGIVGWGDYEKNADSSDHSITPYVICEA